MVYGVWCTVYGIWYMVYGKGFEQEEYGRWYMVYGIWHMGRVSSRRGSLPQRVSGALPDGRQAASKDPNRAGNSST